MTLFRTKPWEFRGRRMERNAPRGYRCDETCTHPVPAQDTKTCLCTVCHETYSTPSNFDRHRKDGWCLEPSTVGLRKSQRGHWVLEDTSGRLDALKARFDGEDYDDQVG